MAVWICLPLPGRFYLLETATGRLSGVLTAMYIHRKFFLFQIRSAERSSCFWLIFSPYMVWDSCCLSAWDCYQIILIVWGQGVDNHLCRLLHHQIPSLVRYMAFPATQEVKVRFSVYRIPPPEKRGSGVTRFGLKACTHVLSESHLSFEPFLSFGELCFSSPSFNPEKSQARQPEKTLCVDALLLMFFIHAMLDKATKQHWGENAGKSLGITSPSEFTQCPSDS